MEKETAKKISTGRKLLFTAIILAVFFLLIEGLLSIYYYQRNGAEKSASVEAIKIIKKSFGTESSGLVYDPWVEYRNKDFSGNGRQTSESVRRSVPDSYYQGTPGDTVDIYFFGGSTMFGSNVADSQTICSHFVKLYKDQLPQGNPVRVFNYGTSNYYSYQELMLLANLIQKGHRPNVLVFLDGINDFHFGIASYYNQSYFSYIFRQFFNSGLKSTGEFKFVDTSYAMFKNPGHLPAEEFNKTLFTNYISNIRSIKMLADMIDARAYFFCQPSPYYNYAGMPQDPTGYKEINTRFNYIYPALEKMQDSLQGFTYLGNMLTGQADDPFIDSLHYSPDFNKKIAEQILSKVSTAILLPAPGKYLPSHSSAVF